MTDQYNNPEVYRPMGLDLPQTEINLKQSGAVLASALALTGVVATGVTRPEQASAQGVDCNAPSGEVPTPRAVATRPGKIIGVSTAVFEKPVCENNTNTLTFDMTNYGTERSSIASFTISNGTRSIIDSMKSVTFNGETFGITNVDNSSSNSGDNSKYNGRPTCIKRDSGSVDNDQASSSWFTCGANGILGINPGETTRVSINMDLSNYSPLIKYKTGPHFELSVDDRTMSSDTYIKNNDINKIVKKFPVYSADGSRVIDTSSSANSNQNDQCPTRPNFNAIYNKSSKTTSFYFKTQPGQTIKANTNLKQLDTPAGRSKMSRVEYIPAGKVDTKKLPKHARKVGNKIVVALTKNVGSSAYQGLKMKYPPKSGTFAKLILPNSPRSVTYTKSANNKNCASGYPTIYAQNLIGK